MLRDSFCCRQIPESSSAECSPPNLEQRSKSWDTKSLRPKSFSSHLTALRKGYPAWSNLQLNFQKWAKEKVAVVEEEVLLAKQMMWGEQVVHIHPVKVIQLCLKSIAEKGKRNWRRYCEQGWRGWGRCKGRGGQRWQERWLSMAASYLISTYP